MNIDELQSYDSSLEFIKQIDSNIEFEGLSSYNMLKSNHIVFAKNNKILQEILKSEATSFNHLGLILEQNLYNEISIEQQKKLQEQFTLLATSDDVQLSMCRLSAPFYQKNVEELNYYVDGRQLGSAHVHPTAFVAQNVFIGQDVEIGENSKILPGSTILPNSKIGKNCTIYPNVTIYPFVQMGDNCRIHSGTIIGADGFGYYFKGGIHHKIYHTGGVQIENDVEIGANSAVDQGTFCPTIIKSGSKVDNFVQIAHNCVIGKGVILCGHVAIGGSVHIGDYTVMAGRSGVGPDIRIGSQSQVAGGALVNCSWPDKSVLGGHPARPLKEWLKGLAFIRKESLKKNNKK